MSSHSESTQYVVGLMTTALLACRIRMKPHVSEILFAGVGFTAVQKPRYDNKGLDMPHLRISSLIHKTGVTTQ